MPGKTLYLSALLAAKKFRNRGNKPAALGAFHELEDAGLGKIDAEERSRGAATVSTCMSPPPKKKIPIEGLIMFMVIHKLKAHSFLEIHVPLILVSRVYSIRAP